MQREVDLLVGDLDGDGVGAVLLLALLPAHKAAKHTPRRAARALPGDGSQLAGEALLHAVELGEGGHQTGEPRGRGCESRARGEGVHGGDVETVLRPVLLAHHHLTAAALTFLITFTRCAVSGEAPDLSQDSERAAIQLDLSPIEPETVRGEALARRDSGDGVQIRLYRV